MKTLEALLKLDFWGVMRQFMLFATHDLTLSSNTSSADFRVVTVTRDDNRPATITENRTIAAAGTAIITIAANTTVIVERASPTKGVTKLIPVVAKEGLSAGPQID